MPFRPSDKQAALARFALRNTLHILVQGAMGGGKTVACVPAWLAWMAERCPPAERHIVAFPDKRQGRYELGDAAREWAEDSGLKLKLGVEAWEVESMLGPPHTVLPMPFGTGGMGSKFKQWNLASIYVDEATEMVAMMRQRLISRLRAIPYPRAIWSYNPDDQHGFKADLFDPVERGELSGEIWRFKMSDNPSLPLGYHAMMLANYPLEHERARYIDGDWAVATGAVYPFRHLSSLLNSEGRVSPPPPGEPLMYIAGVDWAVSTVTCALLRGRWAEGWWVVDEWRHDGARRGEMPTPLQARQMHQHLTANGTRSVRQWTVDRTAGDLLVALAEVAAGEVVPSQGETTDMVRSTARHFDADNLHMAPGCEHTILSVEKHRWPENASYYGTPKPVKDGTEHEAEALRYALCRVAPPMPTRPGRP